MADPSNACAFVCCRLLTTDQYKAQATEKFFNNAGPQLPGDNYTIDPLRRIKLPELQDLIDQKRYFVTS